MAAAALAAACCWSGAALAQPPAASVMSDPSVSRPGGLAVTPNLQIFGRKPSPVSKGGKVTPPERPPVVTSISPGVSEAETASAERGHGAIANTHLGKFYRADGTFLRQ